MTAEDFAALIVRAKKRRNGWWSGRCPAHKDTRPSLAWKSMPDGGLAVKCFAGCPTSTILKSLGLDWSDINPLTGERAVYDYGPYRKVRDEGKRFRIEHVADAEKHVALPYRVDEVTQAIQEGRPIWIVEGERDVEYLRCLGETATTFGGNTSLPADWSWASGGVFMVVPDNDAPGEQWKDAVIRGLSPVAKAVTTLRVKAGKDIRDHLESGLTLQDLHIENAELVVASQVEERDVEWLISPYIPKGEITILYGDSGTGKSMIALNIAAQVSHFAPVLVLAYEDPPFVLRKRLAKAGANLQSVYINEGTLTLPRDFDKFIAMLMLIRPHLLVVDPFPTMMDSSLDWYRDTVVKSVLTRVRQHLSGTTALLIGHTGKAYASSDEESSLKHALLGSAGQIGVARSGLCVISTGDKSGKVLHTKSNWSSRGEPVLFEIMDDAVHWLQPELMEV